MNKILITLGLAPIIFVVIMKTMIDWEKVKTEKDHTIANIIVFIITIGAELIIIGLWW